MNTKFILALIVLLVCSSYVVDATHFRYGAIQWQPVGTAYRTIKFKIDLAFRKSYFSGVKVGGTVTHSTFYFGDGGKTSLVMNVTATDDTNDWFTGTFTYQYTYTKDGNFTAYYSDCCRISTLKNNHDDDWYISSSVLVKPATSQAGGILNTSPSVGSVPIVNVLAERTNIYNVVGYDAEQSNLTYALSWIWGSGLVHPTGLTCSSDGTITWKPPAVTSSVGYDLWCTQIIISDGYSYTVVDFIFQVNKPSGICDASCSNGGTTCSAEADCKSCGSTVTQKCQDNKSPPYFVTPPTPESSSSTVFPIGQESSYTIQSATPYANLSTTIQMANPVGTLFSTTTVNNVTTVVYKWTPTVDNAGSYVVSASTFDNSTQKTAATEGARSFIIVVAKPNCGHGTQNTDGSCTCTGANWNATSNCFQCSQGYYGSTCQPSQKCVNGDSNDGINGDGTCLCWLGYTGDLCDVAITKYCSTADPSSITDKTTISGNFLTPATMTAYLSSASNAASLTLPLSLAKPNNPPLFNLLFVVDVNPTSTTVQNYLTKYANSCINALPEDAQYGFGYFSDIDPVTPYQSKFIMNSNPTGAIESLPYAVSSKSNGQSLSALKQAAASPVAWATGGFRTIIILTDSDYTDTTATETATVKALIDNAIYPIIVSTNSSNTLTKWTNFINNIAGFGSVHTSSGSDWYKQVATSVINEASLKAYPKISQDYGIATAPAAVSVTSGTYSLGYTLKLPSDTSSLPTRPQLILSVIGFGLVTVNINFNHAPVPQPYQVTVNSGSSSSFKLVVTDIDSNLIQVAFPTLPAASMGQITYNGVAITANTYYDIQNFNFVYTAAKGTKGTNTYTYTASDGCLTATSQLTVVTNFVNNAPACPTTALAFNTNINTPASFAITGTDSDGDSLTFTLSTFTDLSGTGSLKLSNGTAASAGIVYSNGQAFTYTQTDNSQSIKGAVKTLSYTINDPYGASATCSATFTLARVNIAPSASAVNATTNPTVQATIPITITDSDSTTGTLTFSSITPSGVTYSICNGANIVASSPISYTISNNIASFQICVTPGVSDNGSPWGSLTFSANDGEASSTPVTIYVNVVGSRPNTAPVVNQIPDWSFTQGTSSPSVTINGTDADQSNGYDLTLTAIITVQPQNGKFIVTGQSTSTTAAASANAPYAITYVPNSAFYGTDTFSYTVADELGVKASPASTTITVIYKDSPPVLNIAPYTFSEDTPSTAKQLSVSDNDLLPGQKGDTVICSITQLPTKFVMLQSDNATKITTVPTRLTDQTNYSYFINTTSQTTYSNLDDTFQASCTDSYGNTVTSTGTIKFIYTNRPPTAADQTVNTVQNTAVSFTFSVNDLETPSTVQVKLLTVPANGKIVCNGVTAAAGSIVSPACVYTPATGLSNWDTTGHLGPLDTVSFLAYDSVDYSTTTASAKFYVEPRNPPVFTGSDHLSTLEDNSLPIVITGQPGNGGSSYSVRILGTVGKGSFQVTYCMPGEGCMNKDIASYPFDVMGATSYNFYFTPLPNDNGDDYMTVNFELFEETTEYTIYSDPMTIVIDVIPVNDPPTIELLQSQVYGANPTDLPSPSAQVSVPMNQSILITFTGNDIDSPLNTLSAIVTSPPLRGTLYAYDASNSNGLTGAKVNRTNNVLTRASVSDPWKMVFVPAAGDSGAGYAQVTVSVMDDQKALSGSGIVLFDVDSVNIAPYITANQTSFSVQTGSAISITQVTFDDPDSTYNNVSLTVSLIDASSGEVVTDANIALSNNYTQACTVSSGVISCLGQKVLLNSFLTTITVNQTTGSYYLRVFVDDLGYNAPSSKRNVSHLTATKDLTVEVTSPDAGVTKTSNKTVLSAAIAGAAAAAGIIAAGVWKLVKRAAPPTNAFFGDSPFADGAVTVNPLYAESANAQVNPLYESD